MFVHIINDQIIKLYQLERRASPTLTVVGISALRLSASFDLDSALIPTVDLVQSHLAEQLSDKLMQLADVGLLAFVGSTSEVEELLERKHRHFRGTSVHSEWLSDSSAARLRPFQPHLRRRDLNTTRLMKSGWSDAHRESGNTTSPWVSYPAALIAQISAAHEGRRRKRVKFELGALPDRLEDHAFLNSVVQDLRLLRVENWTPDDAYSLELSLANLWVRSHIEEYGPLYLARAAGLGWVDCGLRFDDEFVPVFLDEWARALESVGLLSLMIESSAEELATVLWSAEYRLLQASSLQAMYRIRTQQGNPDDIALMSRLGRLRLGGRAGRDRLPDRVRRVLEQSELGPSGRRRGTLAAMPPATPSHVIFLGHGQSPLWRELKDYIEDDVGFECREFNSSPVAGLTAVDRLEELLAECDFALLILTAEDELADGTHVARQNVVHELGLFQGRLGFERGVMLREQGCAEFSNLAGVQVIPFPSGNIRAAFYDVGRLLQDRLP